MEALCKHTWSILELSPFQYSLDTSKLEVLEKELTATLRQNSCASSRSKRRHTPSELQGNYTLVRWLDDRRSHSRHLCIQVYMQESWSSEALFCFPACEPKSSDLITQCSFILTRGSTKSYPIILDYIESMTLCQIRRLPTSLSSSEMAFLVTTWVQREQGKACMGKPLSLTLATPPAIHEAGLSTLSISVPSDSIVHFLEAKRANVSNTHGSSGNFVKKRKRSSSKTASSPLVATATRDEHSFRATSVVENLSLFLLEHFKMDISIFRLQKIECSFASCTDDGKVRLLQTNDVHNTLKDMKAILASHQTKTGSALLNEMKQSTL
jgi:hypothetical protein